VIASHAGLLRPAPPRSDLLVGLFPNDVCTSEFREWAGFDSLYPEEAEAIRQASAKRASEFAAGRRCAHTVLGALGIYGFPVRRNDDRSPAWPSGVVGSITHTTGFCGAVAVEQRRFAGLGVDAEIASRVTPEIWFHILTPAEKAQLEELAPGERDRCAATVFSAKEAFFKAQWPMTRRWVDFDEVSVELYPDADDCHRGTFLILPASAACRSAFAVDAFAGRFRFDANLVVTGIAIEKMSALS
jgi:4'-phosphopantetheinyl transferase EntD